MLWITLAMVGARSLAMGINRLVDREIDARNPRTAGRELPSGRLSLFQVVVFCLASLALLMLVGFPSWRPRFTISGRYRSRPSPSTRI